MGTVEKILKLLAQMSVAELEKLNAELAKLSDPQKTKQNLFNGTPDADVASLERVAGDTIAHLGMLNTSLEIFFVVEKNIPSSFKLTQEEIEHRNKLAEEEKATFTLNIKREKKLAENEAKANIFASLPLIADNYTYEQSKDLEKKAALLQSILPNQNKIWLFLSGIQLRIACNNLKANLLKLENLDIQQNTYEARSITANIALALRYLADAAPGETETGLNNKQRAKQPDSVTFSKRLEIFFSENPELLASTAIQTKFPHLATFLTGDDKELNERVLTSLEMHFADKKNKEDELALRLNVALNAINRNEKFDIVQAHILNLQAYVARYYRDKSMRELQTYFAEDKFFEKYKSDVHYPVQISSLQKFEAELERIDIDESNSNLNNSAYSRSPVLVDVEKGLTYLYALLGQERITALRQQPKVAVNTNVQQKALLALAKKIAKDKNEGRAELHAPRHKAIAQADVNSSAESEKLLAISPLERRALIGNLIFRLRALSDSTLTDEDITNFKQDLPCVMPGIAEISKGQNLDNLIIPHVTHLDGNLLPTLIKLKEKLKFPKSKNGFTTPVSEHFLNQLELFTDSITRTVAALQKIEAAKDFSVSKNLVAPVEEIEAIERKNSTATSRTTLPVVIVESKPSFRNDIPKYQDILSPTMKSILSIKAIQQTASEHRKFLQDKILSLPANERAELLNDFRLISNILSLSNDSVMSTELTEPKAANDFVKLAETKAQLNEESKSRIENILNGLEIDERQVEKDPDMLNHYQKLHLLFADIIPNLDLYNHAHAVARAINSQDIKAMLDALGIFANAVQGSSNMYRYFANAKVWPVMKPEFFVAVKEALIKLKNTSTSESYHDFNQIALMKMGLEAYESIAHPEVKDVLNNIEPDSNIVHAVEDYCISQDRLKKDIADKFLQIEETNAECDAYLANLITTRIQGLNGDTSNISIDHQVDGRTERFTIPMLDIVKSIKSKDTENMFFRALNKEELEPIIKRRSMIRELMQQSSTLSVAIEKYAVVSELSDILKAKQPIAQKLANYANVFAANDSILTKKLDTQNTYWTQLMRKLRDLVAAIVPLVSISKVKNVSNLVTKMQQAKIGLFTHETFGRPAIARLDQPMVRTR